MANANSVIKGIVQNEVVQGLAKQGINVALQQVSKALPVDVMGIVGAFRGVLDGHVSDDDVGKMCGAALGAVGGAIGSIFGSGTVGRMIGDFIGNKVGKALSKLFRGNFGKKARRRKREAAKRARMVKQLQAAGRGMAVIAVQTAQTKLYFDLAKKAQAMGALPAYMNKAFAVGKVVKWVKQLGGWDDPTRRREWQTNGSFDVVKAGNDKRLAEKLQAYEDQAQDMVAKVGAIMVSLKATYEAAKEAKKSPPKLASRAKPDWVRRRASWINWIARSSKKSKRAVAADVNRQIAQRPGRTTEEKFERWEADVKKYFAAVAGKDTGAPIRLGALLGQHSPGRVVHRPVIEREKRYSMGNVVLRPVGANVRSIFSARARTTGVPVGASGGRLRWRPLKTGAARLVRRWTPEARPEFLMGRDTAGLEENGRVYVVEAGDSPWKIAEALTGNGNNWKQLVAANPDKPRASNGSFKQFFAGMRLNVPQAWIDAAVQELERRGIAVKDAVEEAERRAQPEPTPDERISGLSADRKTYVVQSGDSPWRLAERFTGNGNNWPELIRANPQKATMPDGNFRTFSTGERVKLPARWTALLAPVEVPQLPPPAASEPVLLPDPVIPPPRVPVLPPRIVTSPGQPTGRDNRPVLNEPALEPAPADIRDDADAIAQAKALLVTWSRTDGASVPAGVVGYGTAVQDASPIWGARDRLQLQTFATWSNVAQGTQLDVESDLTQAHLDALRDWADAHAAGGQVIEQVPETVISGGRKSGAGVGILVAALVGIAAMAAA